MPLIVHFYYPKLVNKEYVPDVYPFEISQADMNKVLQEPNPLDYAYETMKLLVMEKYEDKPKGRKVPNLLARIETFENDFYDSLVYIFELLNEHDFPISEIKWALIDNRIEKIRKKSESLVNSFKKVMGQ